MHSVEGANFLQTKPPKPTIALNVRTTLTNGHNNNNKKAASSTKETQIRAGSYSGKPVVPVQLVPRSARRLCSQEAPTASHQHHHSTKARYARANRVTGLTGRERGWFFPLSKRTPSFLASPTAPPWAVIRGSLGSNV